MQRLRVKFSRGDEIKFISHLDIVRMWQRAFRRANIPLAYSEGFNPHPKISLAAPLPLGVTSEAEFMDVYFTRWVTPHHFIAAVGQELPPGIKILQAAPVGLNLPALQAQVAFAEYIVDIEEEKDRGEVEAAIASMLMKSTLPWQHMRDTGVKSYDLRALVDDLWVIEWKEMSGSLGIRVRCDASGTGRPEQVTAALGFSGRPRSINRTKIIFKG